MKNKARVIEAQKRSLSKVKKPAAEDSPFEVRINRKKHDILGQKVKGQVGKRGVARDAAIQIRKATLKPQLDSRNKDNVFKDKRIGQFDKNMAEEDKIIQRYTRERIQRSKHSFNLPDENDEEKLTHLGKALGDVTDDYQPEDDDFSDEELQSNLAKYQFGGFAKNEDEDDNDGISDSEENAPRTHREIMQSVIAKAKKHKFERQETKRVTDTLTQTVDDEFKEIRSLLVAESDRFEQEGRIPVMKSDDYDLSVVELAGEAKAVPTDRLKTPQEIAEAEVERLQKLEQDRLRRMKGDNSTLATTNNNKKETNSANLQSSATEDDVEFIPSRIPKINKKSQLQLSYVGDGKMELKTVEIDTLKSPKNIANHHDDDDEQPNDDDDEDEEDDDDEDEEGDDDEEEDDDDDEDDEDDDEEEEEEDEDDDDEHHGKEEETDDEEETNEPKMSKTAMKSNVKSAEKATTPVKRRRSEETDETTSHLPFVYKMPSDCRQLNDLLNGHNIDDQAIILQRILACHSIHLKPQNKQVLQGFFDILLDHSVNLIANSRFKELDNLAKIFYDVGQQIGSHAANKLRNKLMEIHEQFTSKSNFPSFDQLYIFKVIAILFPTSDQYHVVVTPAVVVISQLLAKSTITTTNDIISGLFVVDTVLSYASQSGRFMPEALNFINGVLSLTTTKPPSSVFVLPQFQNLHKQKTFLLDVTTISSSATPSPISLENMVTGHNINIVDVVFVALKLAKKGLLLYKDHASWAAISKPIHDQISVLQQTTNVSAIKLLADEILKESSINKPSLTHLHLQTHKPVPIPLLTPYIEDNYMSKHKNNGDPDKQRKEMKKLKHEYKKEFKGAIREIRKDNKFIAAERLNEQTSKDSARNTKVKALHSVLTQQQAEINVEKRLKGRK